MAGESLYYVVLAAPLACPAFSKNRLCGATKIKYLVQRKNCVDQAVLRAEYHYVCHREYF